MSFFYVYVLQKEDGQFYIGYTSNLRQRINEHKYGKNISTRNGVYKLIYFEAYLNKMDVMGREKFLKSGSGHKYLNKQLKHF